MSHLDVPRSPGKPAEDDLIGRNVRWSFAPSFAVPLPRHISRDHPSNTASSSAGFSDMHSQEPRSGASSRPRGVKGFPEFSSGIKRTKSKFRLPPSSRCNYVPFRKTFRTISNESRRGREKSSINTFNLSIPLSLSVLCHAPTLNRFQASLNNRIAAKHGPNNFWPQAGLDSACQWSHSCRLTNSVFFEIRVMRAALPSELAWLNGELFRP